MLEKAQLLAVLRYAKSQVAKSGDLLSRARQSLLDWHRVVKEYNPQVDYKSFWFGSVVSHRCGCPAWRADSPCKHVVALILLHHREILSSSPHWKEFFTGLEKKQKKQKKNPPRRSGGGSSGWVHPDFGNF